MAAEGSGIRPYTVEMVEYSVKLWKIFQGSKEEVYIRNETDEGELLLET